MTHDGQFYTFFAGTIGSGTGCDPEGGHNCGNQPAGSNYSGSVPFTAANRFYSPQSLFDCNCSECCGSGFSPGHEQNASALAALNKVGLDIGSTVHPMPEMAQIIAMGKKALSGAGVTLKTTDGAALRAAVGFPSTRAVGTEAAFL